MFFLKKKKIIPWYNIQNKTKLVFKKKKNPSNHPMILLIEMNFFSKTKNSEILFILKYILMNISI